jgi:hypothetical protein
MSVSSIDTATATYNNFLILLFYLLGLYFYPFTRAIVPDESTHSSVIETLPSLAVTFCKRSGIINLIMIPNPPTTRDLGAAAIAIEALWYR